MQTSGEAVFVNDMPRFAQELSAAFVLSTVARARLQSVDPTPALVSHCATCVTACVSNVRLQVVTLCANGPSALFDKDPPPLPPPPHLHPPPPPPRRLLSCDCIDNNNNNNHNNERISRVLFQVKYAQLH